MNTATPRRRWRFLIDHWWLVYGVSVAWSLGWVIVYGILAPWADAEIIFYPFVVDSVMGGATAITLIGISLGAGLYGLKKRSMFLFILLLASTLIFWIGYLVLIGPSFGRVLNGFDPDPHLHHEDSDFLNGFAYRLASYIAMPSVGGNGYILYACDSFGVICRVVYRYEGPGSLDELRADWENPACLSVEGENLAVCIAGQIVYTYSPQLTTTPKAP